MKIPQIKYDNYTSTAGGVRQTVNVEATLQSIIDYLAEWKNQALELSEAHELEKTIPTPLFKADNIEIFPNHFIDGDDGYHISGFKSLAEVELAREALLKLTI